MGRKGAGMDVASVKGTAVAQTGRGGDLSKTLDNGDGGKGPSRDGGDF